jgi:hypothetical protein
MQSQIGEVAPLTKEQRTLIKKRLRVQSKPVVEASINVMGVMENISQALGSPLGDVRQMQDDSIRWKAAADEARSAPSWPRTRTRPCWCRTSRRSNG